MLVPTEALSDRDKLLVRVVEDGSDAFGSTGSVVADIYGVVGGANDWRRMVERMAEATALKARGAKTARKLKKSMADRRMECKRE